MIEYTAVSTEEDLQGILSLQKQNLEASLHPGEVQTQGFVTVDHTLEDLQKMHAVEPSIVAKQKDQVIAYVLAMTMQAQSHIHILRPMFELLHTIHFRGKSMSDHTFILIGQVCVDKSYRGTGVFQNLYAAFFHRFKKKYDFAITEIAARNTRSIHAHEKIGFQRLYVYQDEKGEIWELVMYELAGSPAGV